MSEPNNQNTNTQTQEPGTPPANTQQNNNGTPPAIDYEKIANLVAGKQSVAEKDVLKSYFKQQGMSAEEMDKAISAYKEQKAKNTPDVAQLQSSLATANSALATARINQAAQLEVIKQGVPLQSVEYVLKLADFSNVMADDGSVNGEKLAEAITKVLTDVPQLKGTQNTDGNNGGVTKIGGEGNGGNSSQTNTSNSAVPAKRWNRFNN